MSLKQLCTVKGTKVLGHYLQRLAETSEMGASILVALTAEGLLVRGGNGYEKQQ